MLEPDAGCGEEVNEEVLTLSRKCKDLIGYSKNNGDQKDSDKYSQRDVFDPDEKENDDTDEY